MTVLVTALDTVFTPTLNEFAVQTTGGGVYLFRRNVSGAAWALAGHIEANVAKNVGNPSIGSQWQAVSASGTPIFRADE